MRDVVARLKTFIHACIPIHDLVNIVLDYASPAHPLEYKYPIPCLNKSTPKEWSVTYDGNIILNFPPIWDDQKEAERCYINHQPYQNTRLRRAPYCLEFNTKTHQFQSFVEMTIPVPSVDDNGYESWWLSPFLKTETGFLRVHISIPFNHDMHISNIVLNFYTWTKHGTLLGHFPLQISVVDDFLLEDVDVHMVNGNDCFLHLYDQDCYRAHCDAVIVDLKNKHILSHKTRYGGSCDLCSASVIQTSLTIPTNSEKKYVLQDELGYVLVSQSTRDRLKVARIYKSDGKKYHLVTQFELDPTLKRKDLPSLFVHVKDATQFPQLLPDGRIVVVDTDLLWLAERWVF